MDALCRRRYMMGETDKGFTHPSLLIDRRNTNGTCELIKLCKERGESVVVVYDADDGE